MNINKEFLDRVKLYFQDKADEFLDSLNKEATHGFFLNTNKGKKEDILKLIDFEYKDSCFNPNAYYHINDNIGKSIVNELGLIYPQDIESSLSSSLFHLDDVNLIVDLCAAPGGKTIDYMNAYPNARIIANDVSYKRALILASNLERLGLDNASVTLKKPNELAKELKGNADLVILDAPCSGEGMIRKYPEILDTYSISNICNLAAIQSDLLESAYELVKENGHIIYSTCTYAFEEDENQIRDFINKHSDIEIVHLDFNYNYSKLPGTIKLCPINNTEGQFICLLKRKASNTQNSIKYLKTIRNSIVDSFIRTNLDLDDYYLYQNDNKFYLSLNPLFDLGYSTLRNGIYIGDVIKDRFEPNHNLYRANSLIGKYKYVYELNDKEYLDYIRGLEIKGSFTNNYYLVTYKNYSLGFGKASNNVLKNKYPKGLRKP